MSLRESLRTKTKLKNITNSFTIVNKTTIFKGDFFYKHENKQHNEAIFYIFCFKSFSSLTHTLYIYVYKNTRVSKKN